MGLAPQQHTPSWLAYCSQKPNSRTEATSFQSLLSVPIRGVDMKGNLWWLLMGARDTTQVGGAWNYPANHNTEGQPLSSLINSTGMLHLNSMFNFLISSGGNFELLYPFALIFSGVFKVKDSVSPFWHKANNSTSPPPNFYLFFNSDQWAESVFNEG